MKTSDDLRHAPLIRVDRTLSNDGLIKVEQLHCGHTRSGLSGERSALRRRCSKCQLGLPHDWGQM